MDGGKNMTRARTKGQKIADKRRQREQATQLPEVAPVPRRAAQHRENGRFAKVHEDPRIAALNARCARFGIKQNEDGREAMNQPHMSCDLGLVLEKVGTKTEKSELWTVFDQWARAETTYRARYIGRLDRPEAASLTMMRERMETDQSHSIDIRSADEKDRDAVNSWMRWQGFLGRLSGRDVAALHHARRGDGPVLWRDMEPTAQGLFALQALRALADAVDRKG